MSTNDFMEQQFWPALNAFVLSAQQTSLNFFELAKKLDPTTITQLILVNHAIWTALGLISKLETIERDKISKLPIFTGFLLMCLSGLGGSLLVALLTGSVPIFIGKDLFLLTFFLVWIIMAYAPNKVFYRIAKFFPIKFVIVFIEGIFLSRVVCGNVDSAVATFPGSHLTPILLGTFSGFGGSILGGFFLSQIGYSAPHELAKPSWPSKMALLTSSFYYLTQYVFKTKIPPFSIGEAIHTISLNQVVAAAYIFVMLINVVIFASPSKPTKKHNTHRTEEQPTIHHEPKSDPPKKQQQQQQRQQPKSPSDENGKAKGAKNKNKSD